MQKTKLLSALLVTGIFLLPEISTAQVLPPVYPGTIPLSYVRSWDAKIPISDAATMSTRPVTEVQQTTAYVDGLGRPLQSVVKQGALATATGSYADLVTPVYYDEQGLETLKYLPFSSANTDGNFKYDAFSQQQGFYNTQLSGQGESWFYNKTDIEQSPLNRPIKNYPAGNSWVGAGRGVATSYLNNTASEDVRIWNVNSNGTYTSSGAYGNGLLIKTVTADENGKQVIEYKDKEGKVILKKVQLDNSPGLNHDGWLCTYYIYDIYNNLRLVIQPKAITILKGNGWNITSTIQDELCFRYEYDDKNRMSIKKVPGAAEVYMVYDKWDRLVLTQDGNLRANNKWIFTKYDNLNRPVMTGFYTDNSHMGQAGMQGYVNTLMTSAARYEDRAANSIGYTTGNSFPSINSSDLLTINFYDDYSWCENYNASLATKDNSNDNLFYSSGTSLYAQPLTQSNKTKGLQTGSVVYVLNSSSGQKLVSSIFYDDRGRAIQTKSGNITGGTDIATTQYDFSGKPLMSLLQHEKSGTNAQIIKLITKNEYDALGRVTSIKKSINQTANGVTIPANPTEKTIATNQYNLLGQLARKNLAPAFNSNAGLESLSYDYNIRGWMTGMNKNYLNGNSSNYFGMELAYDKTASASPGTSYLAAQYNGNITGTNWRSKGDGVNRQYDFAYDNVNRFLRADFKELQSGSWTTGAGTFDVKMGDGINPGSAYDENGNIKRMQQRGLKINQASMIDDLTYNYANSETSNKLVKVTDAFSDPSTKLGDFKDGTNTGNDYDYDVNGNMTIDRNKNIITNGIIVGPGITYNHLNLPSTIQVDGKGSIEYVYDAAGNKLKKIVHENNKPDKVTTYVGGVVYEDDVLQFAPQEEGRIRFKPAQGNTPADFAYDYFIKDHLGNVRMVLTEENRTDAYPAATMETNMATVEETFYNNLPSTRTAAPTGDGYPANTPQGNALVAKVNGNGNKIGPAILLKVMAGDKFNVMVNSWYNDHGSSPGQPVNILSTLLEALNNTVGNLADGKASAQQLQASNAFNSGATSFLDNRNNSTIGSRPRAFLNWILFDEQFKYVSSSSGFEQVGNSQVYSTHVRSNMPINNNGYLYIYVSNETPNIDVFFDNLQVTHIRGQILEETHYYPFGLTMAGISTKAAGGMQNKEKTFQGQRFDDDLGLSWDQFKWRNHDPQIGRFLELDPLSEKYFYNSTYAFSENKVIAHVELEGLEAKPIGTIFDNAGSVFTIKKITSNGKPKNNKAAGITIKQTGENPEDNQRLIGSTSTNKVEKKSSISTPFGDEISLTKYVGETSGKEGKVLTTDASTVNGKPEGGSINLLGIATVGYSKDMSVSGGLGVNGYEVHGSIGVGVGMGQISFGVSHTSNDKTVKGGDVTIRPGGGVLGVVAGTMILSWAAPIFGIAL